MNKKSDIEMSRQETILITRTLIRLKHRLAADRELNEILPAKLAEFDAAIQGGNLLELEEVNDESDFKAFVEDIGL